MDDDTVIEVYTMVRDDEDNIIGKNLATVVTMSELSAYILASFDGETEPTWA